MREEALLLTSAGSVDTANLTKVLRFFGVPCRHVTIEEFLSCASENHPNAPKTKLLCSASAFLQLIAGPDESSAANRHWQKHLHSVFVYGANDADALKRLARILARDDEAGIEVVKQCDRDLVVSDQMDEFCSAMAGLRIPASSKANGSICSVTTTATPGATSIVSAGSGAIFLKVDYENVPVFLSASSSIIDLDATLAAGIFDIRDYVSSALPIVLYIKWAFVGTCWSSTEANACLIIDDPLLKPTHGLVDFRELLSLMKSHRFSTNIAFIPWNWRRSSSEIVRLFRENPENYSISVHGCDHTRAEFGGSDRQRVYWKAKQALERMNRHESKTGIRHDRVMVFPQGVFSQEAMRALKHTDFVAAVNNDTISVDPHFSSMTISDLWDVAVMSYDNFPIFTRRYPWEGVENFAFDILLGKPAIIVIHRDYCSDHCRRLINFVERLNALKRPLKWRSLGEVVRRSFRQREIAPGMVEVEMYGTEMRIENRSERRKRYLLRRRESVPSGIKEIRAGSAKVDFHSTEDCVGFEVDLDPGEKTLINIRFHDLAVAARRNDKFSYRASTMLRRYLCEVRDNYITTTKSRLADFVSR